MHRQGPPLEIHLQRIDSVTFDDSVDLNIHGLHKHNLILIAPILFGGAARARGVVVLFLATRSLRSTALGAARSVALPPTT